MNNIIQKLNKFNLTRAAIFIVGVFIIMYMLPTSKKLNFSYEIGSKWEHPSLVAPYEIPVYLDDEVQEYKIDSLKKVFVPKYAFVDEPLKPLEDKLYSLEMPDGYEPKKIIKEIEGIYKNGVVDLDTYTQIGKYTEIIVNKGVNPFELKVKPVISTDMAKGEVSKLLQSLYELGKLSEAEVNQLIVPSIIKDEERTNQEWERLIAPFKAEISILNPGEKIIERGDIVTQQAAKNVDTYVKMFNERYQTTTARRFAGFIGRLMVAVLVMSAMMVYLFLYRRDLFNSWRSLLAVMSVFMLFYILGVVISASFYLGVFLVPFAILAVLFVVFFDAQTAIFFYLIEILLCACYTPSPLELIFIEMAVGLVAIFSLRELSRRSQLLRTALMAFGAYIISYLAIDMMITASFHTLSWRMVGFFAINGVLITFAYILIFVVEKAFGLISSVTLVELSDINLPLLRALSEKCPGTFQHAMGVGNLAAIAATRIGADPLLVRSGALYHDIGKINNPAFFTENQHGVNPHDSLSPEQSAYVLHRHVTDGLKMAEKAKLPAVIRDMIAQHHGKSKAKYFYIKYQQQHPGEPVDEEMFTYPGPNPQTKEASLLMMADAVEAASRSLSDYSQESITRLVNAIVDGQVAEGLHRESPLSFRDIMLAKEAFISRLRTMYHTRIAYPPAPSAPKESDTNRDDEDDDTLNDDEE